MLNTLNVAQSGLHTSQTQVENVMNNIANENTPGYKKRVVNIVEAEHNDARITGRGVQVVDVARITNIYMYDKLNNENSKKSYMNQLSTMLEDIESIFYETEDSGVSYDLEKFFNALENLRLSPNDEIYRSNLRDAGKVLVDDLKKIYNDIEDLQKRNLSFLRDHVDETNEIIQDIGKVNQKIIDSVTQPNDLLDSRDNLEKRLSQYLDIKVDRTDKEYSLDAGGLTAVRYNTNVHNIFLKEQNLAQKDVYVDTENNSTLVNKTTWNDSGDSVTVFINKDFSVTATYGESYDIDGDGNNETIDETNVVRAIVSKINNDPEISKLVKAWNGQYIIDENGNKQPMEPTNQDHYLLIESKFVGEEGQFESKVFVNDDDNLDSDGNQVLYKVQKSDLRSVEATNDIHLEIFNNEVPLKSGKMKAIIENLSTNETENKFKRYKQMLDNFAKKLADLMDSYIFIGDKALDRKGEYIYGKEASLLHKDRAKMKTIKLFEGSDVKSLKFNDAKVNELTQDELDYLTSVRWKDDIDFDGNGGKNSLTSYYHQIRVRVSSDKENIDYLKENQEAVLNALQLSYDKITKVNKDDEMLNLIKFQRAYEANAKVITVVDQMLQTLLNLKR